MTRDLALTPGSPRAKKLGCLCPVIDNGHGWGHHKQGSETLYVIREDCPMHGSESTHAMRRVKDAANNPKEKK